MTTVAMIHQLRFELWNLTYTQWKTQTLFSIQWWSIVAIIAISYVIWWVIVDKRRLSEILLYGSFVSIQRIAFDIIGTNAILWSYNIRETPFFPSPFSLDFTLMALVFMVIYQYCHSWKKFLIWTGVTTGIICFAVYPVLIKLGFLKLYNWNLLFAFILVFGVPVFSRWVLLGVLNIQQNHK